jgi:hypothetical protein
MPGMIVKLLCCAVSFLIRSNTVQKNSMRIGKAFCMSMGGSSDRSNVCWEERQICTQGVYYSKNKMLPLHDRIGPM